MKLSAVLSSSILLITLFLLSSSQLHAQSNLALSSGTVLPGGTTSLSLSLSSPGSNQPAAIQWTLTYPAASVASLNVTAGPALSSVGKTVTCAGGAGAVTCVAWGLNSTTISDGVVANVSVTLSGGSAAPISISNSLGASPAGDAITVIGIGGGVSVNAVSVPLRSLQSVPSPALRELWAPFPPVFVGWLSAHLPEEVSA